MYLHNFETDRWPCGDPRLGLTDTDGSPTKSAITQAGAQATTYQFCFGKRCADELYHIGDDPDCVVNLAEQPDYKGLAATLKAELFAELKRQQDPRVLGNGDVFDQYRSPKEARNQGRVALVLKKAGKKN
jgi:N-sulfoglucosamine sulfohydrolase